MKYKAIFLDVDGVLVDSERVFNICWRKAAEMEGYTMSFEQALLLRSLDSALAQNLFVSWYGDEKAYAAIRGRRKLLMSSYNKENSLDVKPGVNEFLKEASKLDIKVAIVTSSPISRITDYLNSVGINARCFDTIITTEQVSRGKPYPDVYQYACKAIGYFPEQCIAVEDSPNGVKSAHDAGCYTVMIPDLSPLTEDLKDSVDCICDSIIDVLHHIRN